MEITIPEFKISANSTKEEKEIREKLEGCFGEKHFDDIPAELLEEIKNFESKKTEAELKAIEFANQIANQLLDECGINSYKFPEKNIHIFPAQLYRKTTGSGSSGRADLIRQAIILNADKVRGKGNLRFANIVFHEMLHVKSFGLFNLQVNGNTGFTQRGLEIELKCNSKDQNEIYARWSGLFGGLNEAIASYYERYFVRKALKGDSFKEEKEWLESYEAKVLRKKLSQEWNYNEDDIYTVTKEGRFDTHCYPKHEKVLEQISDKIYQDNPQRFNSKEEVIKEFLKAMLNGDTIDIGKLIEKSFGSKSFKILGTMTEDSQLAVNMLEFFK